MPPAAAYSSAVMSADSAAWPRCSSWEATPTTASRLPASRPASAMRPATSARPRAPAVATCTATRHSTSPCCHSSHTTSTVPEGAGQVGRSPQSTPLPLHKHAVTSCAHLSIPAAATSCAMLVGSGQVNGLPACSLPCSALLHGSASHPALQPPHRCPGLPCIAPASTASMLAAASTLAACPPAGTSSNAPPATACKCGQGGVEWSGCVVWLLSAASSWPCNTTFGTWHHAFLPAPLPLSHSAPQIDCQCTHALAYMYLTCACATATRLALVMVLLQCIELP